MHPYPHDPHHPDPDHPDPHHPDDVAEQVAQVRVEGLVDLIAAVPYVLTYVPQDAVVVMVFVGDTLRVTVCQALPALAEVALAGGYLDQVLRRACREPGDEHRPAQPAREDPDPQVTYALVVGYGPAAIDPILTGIADRLTIPVQDVVRVLDDRWWSLTCPDPGCCPPGAPVEAPERVRLALLVAAGVPAATRSERTSELRCAPRAVLDQVTAAIAGHGDDPAPDPGPQYALLTAAKARHDRTGAGAEAGPLGAAEAAALLLALDDVRVRDACTLWNDQAAVHLWQELVGLAPPGWVAPAATLLALAAYQRGDSVLADLAVDRALDDDPRYRLAGMIREVLRLGLPPNRLAAYLQDMAEDVLSRLAAPGPQPPTGSAGDAGTDDHDRRM